MNKTHQVIRNIRTALRVKSPEVRRRFARANRYRFFRRSRRWFSILGRFVAKEFLHIFRDPRTLIIILGLPVLLIGVFGFALTTEVGELRILVVTPQNNAFVTGLANRLDASSSAQIVDIVPPSQEYDALFQKNEIDAILRLESHFEHKLIRNDKPQMELIIDGVDPNVAAAGGGTIAGVIREYLVDFTASMGENPKEQLNTQVTLLYNPELRASYYFVPGVMGLVLMIICALMTSVSIVREKEYGSMDLLLTGPVHPGVIILAKAIPYFLLSCIDIVSILILARFVLQVPLSGSVTALVFVSMVFILVALLLGLLISTSTKSQLNAVIMSGLGLLLPVSILSGMIFPLESMPRFLFYVAHCIPATWYVMAAKKLMMQGAGWADVQIELYVLLGMASAFVGIAVLTFKNRTE